MKKEDGKPVNENLVSFTCPCCDKTVTYLVLRDKKYFCKTCLKKIK